MKKIKKLAFICINKSSVIKKYQELKQIYGDYPPQEAEVIIILGGDGFMLDNAHKFMHLNIPLYGMNFGSVGFLMNDYTKYNLLSILEKADKIFIYPLQIIVEHLNGKKDTALAINEVSLLRQIHQTAKIRIWIDNMIRIPELMCDGIIVATPAGSTAYNLSSYGPIIPMEAKLLALTPLAPFRPRHWRGALLSHKSHIKFEILEYEKRPVSATADKNEFRDIIRVFIKEDNSKKVILLFDNKHNFREKILKEQFTY